jgi:hypothetical protein
MEEVFNILFISKDLPEIFRRSGPRRQPGFRREIQDFLRVLVGLLRFVQQNPSYPEKIDHHLALARSLTDGDTVLSLNYDTFADYALLQTGWNPSIGYGFDVGRGLDYQAVPRTTISRAQRLARDILLLKPHGSLNWFAAGSLREYEDLLTESYPSLVLMSPAPRAYNPRGRGLVRFFIPPLYSKFFGNPFWRSLWEQGFGSMVSAEVLLIIGCSMIRTDFHLRSIFVRALLKRRGKKFRKIIIVEPSRDVRRELRKLLWGRSMEGFEWHDSFTDYVQERLELS